MINKVSQGLRLLAKPLLLNIPFFLWSLLLQCPLLISWLHNAPLKALYMFFNIGDGATSDLYFVIILSIVIVYVCYIVSKITIVGGAISENFNLCIAYFDFHNSKVFDE